MLRRTFVPGITLALAFLATACGPSASGDDDDDTPGGDGGSDTCSGSETRCVGTQYQTCSGGTFQTTENCPNACDATRGGCLDCVPGTGNACNGNNQVVTCNADGSFGSVVESCAAGTSCEGGMCQRGCSADGVDLIYVVDNMYRLHAFDPRMIAGNPFRLIGQINCPNPGAPIDGGLGTATPFSMAVDRDAVAWVLYNSGKIFKVSTTDASCTATSFTARQMAGSQRWDLFGMGFVTDAAGGDTEKLWIAGGSTTGNVPGSVGWIDSTSLAVNYVAAMGVTNEYSAELTGLGDATLWAFLPATTQMAYIQQVNKMTGVGVGSQLRFSMGTGQVLAWAFAQWGGKFYVFVTTGIAAPGTSNVIEVDRATGQSRTVVTNSGKMVVGAGVSTCAPVVIGGPTQDAPLTSAVETSTVAP